MHESSKSFVSWLSEHEQYMNSGPCLGLWCAPFKCRIRT